MRKGLFIVGIGFLIIAGFLFYFAKSPKVAINSFEECVAAGFPVMESYPRQCRADGKNFVELIVVPFVSEKIAVFYPLASSYISSPLTVRGEARGFWYFEASFPVRLLDANRKELAVKPAQAKGEWMTEEFVPFEVTLEFVKPATSTGILRLEKDNPSGLPENDESIEIPVRFQ